MENHDELLRETLGKIKKLEEILGEIRELRGRIYNPDPKRRLSENRGLKSELKKLEDTPGLALFKNIKEELNRARKFRRELYQIVENRHVCILVGRSESNLPKMLYFHKAGGTTVIPTDTDFTLIAITPAVFLITLMAGSGFLR